jgi:hypothetical protein
VHSFSAEKIRITGLLSASESGRKLWPALFMKGREGTPIKEVAGTRWLTSAKSWMNQDLFIKWIQFKFPFVARNSILLVFDSARSHISAKVKSYLHSRGILFAVIPGGLTGLLQPCDVAWFKPLKFSISKCIDSWKATGQHTYTRNGTARPPGNEVMSTWVSTSWNEIAPERMQTASFDASWTIVWSCT